MDIKNMKTEDIESLSYLDIAYRLIKQEKKVMTTVELFKEICTLLNFSDKQFENLIGDFYTSLTVDKRFFLLDDGKWDLKENHSVKIVIEDELDELDELDGLDTIEEIDEESEEDKEVFPDVAEDEEINGDDIESIEDIDEIEDTDIDELEKLTILEDEEEEKKTDL